MRTARDTRNDLPLGQACSKSHQTSALDQIHHPSHPLVHSVWKRTDSQDEKRIAAVSVSLRRVRWKLREVLTKVVDWIEKAPYQPDDMMFHKSGQA